MTSASPYSDKEESNTPQGNGRLSSPADTGILPSEVDGLPRKQPPLASSCWLHGTQPGNGEVSVIASQDALKQITALGNSDLSCELGGALLGTAFRHDNRVFVELKAALPAKTRDHGPVHFKFTADSWAQLHQERSSDYPDLDIVGWFHTHPNLGIFYSADDVVVHTAAFTLPWHVGLVVDPVRNEASFFGWANGTLSAINGFYEVRGSEARSSVPWKYVPSAVWTENDDPGSPLASGSRVYAPASGWPSLPTYAAPLGLLAGAVGLLLGFFLLVAWIVVLNQRIDRLEDVALTLSQEALGDTNGSVCPDARLRLLSPLTGARASVGSSISFIGTADYPNAVRYRVEARPADSDDWALIGTRRSDTALGRLAVWDTVDYLPETYEVRLAAVDRNNILLPGSADCVIGVELVP